MMENTSWDPSFHGQDAAFLQYPWPMTQFSLQVYPFMINSIHYQQSMVIPNISLLKILTNPASPPIWL